MNSKAVHVVGLLDLLTLMIGAAIIGGAMAGAEIAARGPMGFIVAAAAALPAAVAAVVGFGAFVRKALLAPVVRAHPVLPYLAAGACIVVLASLSFLSVNWLLAVIP